MFPAEIFRGTIEKFVSILVRHQIRFHLTGGITSVAYGEPRLTQDIDFVVDPLALNQHLDAVCSELNAARFLFDEPSVRAAVQNAGLFQLLDRDEMLKLDIYPRELIPGELSRSKSLELFAGWELPIVSRADAAVSKLIWISKGSHKSRRDLRRIFRGSDATTQLAITQLADELQLRPLLNEVLRESDEVA